MGQDRDTAPGGGHNRGGGGGGGTGIGPKANGVRTRVGQLIGVVKLFPVVLSQ